MKYLLKDTNISIELLTGSTLKKDKQRIYKDLKDGNVDMIIGTHALIQEEVEYHNLGLVITDEQHRFGVNQRANLQNKGIRPDILYMSATPIPRTYALTIYGDMDMSIIKERPKGRKPIKTYVKNNDEIKDVLEELGALDKAVKLNTGFIDRLCNGLSLSDESRKKIREARRELSETRNLQVLKSGH